MTRLAMLLLASVPLLAQTQERRSPSLIPISGRVLNAVTGEPIPGATVHYRGSGNVSEGNGTVTAPPSMQGEVTAASDGSYTTRPLPAYGDFTIRASAPGFFSKKEYLQALPKEQQAETAPTPAGYKGPLTPMYPSTLRLYPDPLNLKPMSESALAALAAPAGYWVANRSLRAAQFSPDGSHFAFIAMDILAQRDGTSTRTCKVWSYDLDTGSMVGAELPGSPIIVRPPNYEQPPTFCANDSVLQARAYYSVGYSISWADHALYLIHIGIPEANPDKTLAPSRMVDVYLLRDSALSPASPASRPPAIQAAIADRMKAHPLSEPPALPSQTRFVLRFPDPVGRSTCSPVLAVTSKPASRRILAEACPQFSQLLDSGRKLFFFTQPPALPYPNKFESLGEFNLDTGRKRTFKLPVMNREPELLLSYALPGGATRIAYTIRGDCDYNASDYSQPFQPDGVLGQTPNQVSICFVRIPPAAAH